MSEGFPIHTSKTFSRKIDFSFPFTQEERGKKKEERRKKKEERRRKKKSRAKKGGIFMFGCAEKGREGKGREFLLERWKDGKMEELAGRVSE